MAEFKFTDSNVSGLIVMSNASYKCRDFVTLIQETICDEEICLNQWV